ncbi:MAG: hypothetical protein BZY80_05190 [SAR202 cluster bacterium Io17-Chloro-G2]|nr:MAG: hypothetical protein BZY80_05190 [SAR202 cluster bacterium Io17-Chloro-G2]
MVRVGLKIPTIGARFWVSASPIVLLAALAWLSGFPVAHAQGPPRHVWSGNAFIDLNPAPDGTTISAWIEGNVIAETTVQGGKFTLTMEEPPGESYLGKLVTYQVGELQTGDIGPWPEGEAFTRGDLHVYPGTPFDQERVARRLIRECVTIALGWMPSGPDYLTPQDVRKALGLCPDLEGHMAALEWEHPEYHVFEGTAVLFGGPAEDGTGVAAFIDGVNISGTRTRDGRFRLEVPQAPGQSFLGRMVEFRGSTAQGRRLAWLKSAVWKGSGTSITLGPEVRYSSQEGLEDSSDPGTLECIRGVLGYLPSHTQEMTQDQREAAGRACPGAKDRLGRVLNPAAVDRSNRECIERVLGYSPPATRTMTADETRLVQGACFWGKPKGGAPALDPVPTRGQTRGFFINSASGDMAQVDDLMDPTSLAVLGLLLTLLATSLTLVKGN